MKKRFLSLMLAVCLCFGMTAHAFVVDGIDYPEAGSLNLETQVGNGSVTIFWEPPREIEVPIVEHYAYVRNYDTDFELQYIPVSGECVCEFTGLKNNVEYDAGVVYIYETGFEIEAGAFIIPLDGIPPELMAPEAWATFENGVLTVSWVYAGDVRDVACFRIDVVSEEEIQSADVYADDPANYTHTFDSISSDTFTVLVCAVDHYGNTGDYAVMEIPEPAPTEEPDDPAVWPFTDVDKNHPNYDAINFVYNAGLMNGTNDGSTFSPDMNLSRAMVARILHTLVGNPSAKPSDFTDVKRNFWYTEAIDWASNYKIISGNGQGQFMPNNDVTHEQLAVMLYHFARATGFDVENTAPADLTAYYDGQLVSSWAKTAVQWACATGVLTDDGYGNLLPTEPATRAEVAEALLAFVLFYS